MVTFHYNKQANLPSCIDSSAECYFLLRYFVYISDIRYVAHVYYLSFRLYLGIRDQAFLGLLRIIAT